MKKELTVYCIKYGKSPKAFIAIADNRVHLIFIKIYFDVDDSIIYESFIDTEYIPLIKDLCKDTGKKTILNLNHPVQAIREFINKILGHNITWKEYSLKRWNDFIIGFEEYSLNNQSIIEIDHPISLKDEILISIMKEGLKYFEIRQKEIKKLFKKDKKCNNGRK